MSDQAKAAGVVEYDAIVVGAGFGGLYQLYKLREAGMSVRVIEAGEDIGGTWFWNRYPGARVDVESMQYSYSFSEELAQEWEWTEKYATQPELLKYIHHVANRFDMMKDIQLNTRVTSGHINDKTGRWTVKTDKGDLFSAQFFILATGCLTIRKTPDFKGLDSFKGQWYMSSDYPQGTDLKGKRVGIIGTGSTGVQMTVTLAPEVGHLTVFQRTANFCMPAWNEPASKEYVARVKKDYPALRAFAKSSPNAIAELRPDKNYADFKTPEELEAHFDHCWAQGGFVLPFAFLDAGMSKEGNAKIVDYVHRKIRAAVKDPQTADDLMPKDHPIGTKRPCVADGYYETFNRDNVDLVNLRRTPIEEITPNGIRLSDGTEVELDVIIFAIGFDAMTGSLLAIDIQGRGGRKLRDEWKDGPQTYLGLTISGFPNMFTITGPQSPSVLAQMIYGVEQHVDWIMDCMAHMKRHGYDIVEAQPQAQQDWVDHTNEVGATTLMSEAEHTSWYMGANVEGKPRMVYMYLGGFPAYRAKCDEIAQNDYEGFKFEAVAEKAVA